MKNLSFFISAAALFAIGTAYAAVNQYATDFTTIDGDNTGKLEITPTTPDKEPILWDGDYQIVTDPTLKADTSTNIGTGTDSNTGSDACGITFPTCEEMGYKTAKANCGTGKYTVCPSDPNKVRCLRAPSVGELKYSLQTGNHNGWLFCNGQDVSRTKYQTLFNKLGTTFGTGDGSTTFNLPDYRGFFLRGYGLATGLSSYGGSANYSTSTPQKEELPNVVGYWTDSYEDYPSPTGALSVISTAGDGIDGGKGWFGRMSINVSRSSSIYKAGGHVIPANYGVNVFIYSGVK